jgi:hypothetical protein
MYGVLYLYEVFVACLVQTLEKNTRIFVTTRVSTVNVLCLSITIVDIIHRPVFYLKHDVSENGFCSNPVRSI